MRFSVVAAAAALLSTAFAVAVESDGVVTSVVPITGPRSVKKYADPARVKRGTKNISGNHCETVCGGSAGAGPNGGDCQRIVQDLWNMSGQIFSVNPGTSFTKNYGSCVVQFFNPTNDVLQYDYGLMGSVANYMNGACNAAHGSSYGWCWFDQSGYDRNVYGDYPGIELLHSWW